MYIHSILYAFIIPTLETQYPYGGQGIIGEENSVQHNYNQDFSIHTYTTPESSTCMSSHLQRHSYSWTHLYLIKHSTKRTLATWHTHQDAVRTLHLCVWALVQLFKDVQIHSNKLYRNARPFHLDRGAGPYIYGQYGHD